MFKFFSLFFLSLKITFSFSQVNFTDSNLPIVVITTPNGEEIVDEFRILADMGIIDNGIDNRNYIINPFNNYNGKIAIEIRGSTSQQYPKKGYGFETQDNSGLNNDVELLGMPSENDWILNGPYPDKTLIRDVLTFDLAQKMGNYASNWRFCELVINNQYLGVYILMERIKRDDKRVNIAPLDADDLAGDSLTGGYIVKVDKLTGENDGSWASNYNSEVVFQVHDPEYDELNQIQFNYIKNYISDFEDKMNSSDFDDPVIGYSSMIETTSFYDFFILQELGRTVDGYRSSAFLHKDKIGGAFDGKLVAGPMWDFNLSYGNADYCDAMLTTGWQYNFDEICDFTSAIPFWWEKLLESSTYRNGLKCRWQELRNGPLHTDSIHFFIDSLAIYLEEARIRNFIQWPIIGVYVNWNAFVGITYEEDLDYFKNYITERAIWIDNNLQGNCDATISEMNNSTSFLLFPNPTQNKFTINHKTNLKSIHIFDFCGKEIYHQNSNKNSENIELNLPNGIYYCEIKDQNNNTFIKKISILKP